MTPTTFLLVRHAHAEWVADEMRPLSAKGAKDAETVAGILVPLSPVAVYSSPYTRARQTVEPLSALLSMPIQELAELRERSLGHGWEKDWLAAIRPTWEDFSFAYPDGGETNAEAMARAKVVLETLLARHTRQTVVVATHGNLLVLLLRLLDPGMGFEFWRTLTLPDIYRLDVYPDDTFELLRLWPQRDPS